jgi:hypothetical protein
LGTENVQVLVTVSLKGGWEEFFTLSILWFVITSLTEQYFLLNFRVKT